MTPLSAGKPADYEPVDAQQRLQLESRYYERVKLHTFSAVVKLFCVVM